MSAKRDEERERRWSAVEARAKRAGPVTAEEAWQMAERAMDGPLAFEDVYRLCRTLNWLWEGNAEAIQAMETHRLRVMPYPEYLQTEHWRGLRAAKLEEAGYRCQLCNGAAGLEVHHRTYERRGRELLDDLTVLCVDCHGKFHDRLPQP